MIASFALAVLHETTKARTERHPPTKTLNKFKKNYNESYYSYRLFSTNSSDSAYMSSMSQPEPRRGPQGLRLGGSDTDSADEKGASEGATNKKQLMSFSQPVHLGEDVLLTQMSTQSSQVGNVSIYIYSCIYD